MNFLLKFLERATWFFTPAFIVVIGFEIKYLWEHPTWQLWLLLISTLWLLPPLLWRLVALVFPVKIGKMPIGPQHPPCSWFIAHRLQLPYTIFPVLEKFLLVLPGIYSVWLRLWGSKVGRFVFFAPDVRILDRTHLIIGNKTFVGGATISCHTVIKNKGEYLLWVQPVQIGNDCFIATQCNIGPGTVIADGEALRVMTQTLGAARKELV